MKIDLATLTSNPESETLEFKESFDSKVLETIGAFANATGGTILIGVRDDGHITGIVIGSNSLEEWAQKMQAKIQPRFFPSIVTHKHGSRTVAAIEVERSDSPISVDGRFYKRVGKTNQIMSPEEIKQRLLASSGTSWDAQIVLEANLRDLDDEAIASFISLMKATGRRPVGTESNQDILRKLELIAEGKPTRAALLLLGRRPQKFFMDAFVQLGRFRSPIQIVDSKRLDGNILTQIQEGMVWFEQRLETEYVITGKPTREEKWEYPLPAVREALINALCHREYGALTNTQVRLYDDRLEIWNPGALLIPLTPAKLLVEHVSLRRNPLIALSLFYAGFIESWGSGTLRIAALAKESNLEVPQFTSEQDEFRLSLRKRVLTKSPLTQLGLNERQIEAVQHVADQGRITNREYQELWSVSRATAGRELSELVDKHVFLRHGEAGKNIFYTLAGANAS